MIFVLMGKSASGKDTVLNKLLSDEELGLSRAVQATTRSARAGEVEGVDYYFLTNEQYSNIPKSDIAEERAYNVYDNGKEDIWRYLTLFKELDRDEDVICIGTLKSYKAIREKYGDKVTPIYIEVDNKTRVNRAIDRASSHCDWKELFRRFLEDEEDFDYEALKEAGLTVEDVFDNTYLDTCISNIKKYIEYRRVVHKN